MIYDEQIINKSPLYDKFNLQGKFLVRNPGIDKWCNLVHGYFQ